MHVCACRIFDQIKREGSIALASPTKHNARGFLCSIQAIGNLNYTTKVAGTSDGCRWDQDNYLQLDRKSLDDFAMENKVREAKHIWLQLSPDHSDYGCLYVNLEGEVRVYGVQGFPTLQPKALQELDQDFYRLTHLAVLDQEHLPSYPTLREFIQLIDYVENKDQVMSIFNQQIKKIKF